MPRDASTWFSALILWLCIGLILSILIYRGSFRFWKYPLSDLGALKTVNGKSNISARSLFDLTMIVSGLIMIRIYSLFSTAPELRHAGIKTTMTLIISCGFFILLMPDDVSDPIHEIGASLVFGMFWGLAILLSNEMNHLHFRSRPIISQIVLQGTVLPYAFLFAIQIKAEDAIQKFAVVGLMTALWLTTRVGKSDIKKGHFPYH